MDNLEINLAIAKIECVVIEHITNTDNSILVCSEDVEQEYKLYNPLTDDALLWKLAKKYRVSIEYFAEWQRQAAESDVIAYIEMGEGIWCAASVYFRDGDESLNKAILLAIIEAHKD